MIDRVTPDPKCSVCRGTGHVRAQFDCECLLREGKAPLWCRAVNALVGDPRPKGRSTVTGRRRFLQTLATGVVAGAAAAVALPKAPGAYAWMKSDLERAYPLMEGAVIPIDKGYDHGVAWYSIYGQNILEPSNIIIAETA